MTDRKSEELEEASQQGQKQNNNNKMENEGFEEKLDDETLESLLQDARFSYQQSLNNLTELRDKAIAMIQINGVVLTILASVTTQIDVPEYTNKLTIFALLGFTISIVVAGISIRSRQVGGGIRESTVDSVIERLLSPTQYYLFMIKKEYAPHNRQALNEIKSRKKEIQISVVAFIIGVIFLMAGTIFSIATA